jgi:hypothetical protein
MKLQGLVSPIARSLVYQDNCARDPDNVKYRDALN